MRLLNQTLQALERAGFTVHTHSLTPCNDGGIAFGQAVVVACGGGTNLPGSPAWPE